NDGQADSAPATVSITVTPVNDPPGTSGTVVADDSYTTPEDTTLTVIAPEIVRASCRESGDPLTAIVVSNPTHGSLTLNYASSFTYTPAPRYCGSDVCTYNVNDGQADSAPATVSITVTPVNDPPGTSGTVVADDSYTTPEDTTLTVIAP